MMTIQEKAKKKLAAAYAGIESNSRSADDPSRLLLYWFDRDAFFSAKRALLDEGTRVVSCKLTPCQVMRASGNTVVYATPEVWSRMCVRQGSWYRKSDRFGQYMMMSERKLPPAFDRYLDVEITRSNFRPETLPSIAELQALVESAAYQEGKPEAWEKKGPLDAIMFKMLFSLTRFWGWGDNLKKHWLSHKANHANFLARHFTTELDGQTVPYSIAENSGICSSCVQYFNVSGDKSRKLVRACPGSVTFGGTERDLYLDVKPVQADINVLG
ncbi:MAG: hypothetical protein HKN13_07995 [Rhodothermales bacterium]|nr:hypothetical protein [Rhodothermales bacterium]